jgi:undecaprenyl-diphosphatase
LTEFLPVSSSGHLVVFERLLRFEEPPLLTTVVLHLGTLFATVVVFRRDLLALFLALPRVFRRRTGVASETDSDPEVRLLRLLIVGCVPTALIGLAVRDLFERAFSSLAAVGVGFLVSAVVLFLTRFVRTEGRRALGGMKTLDALGIGLAQGIAIAPGISRSGSTISAALFFGLDRELSGRYSFLLSLPAIVGANLLEFRHLPDDGWGSGVAAPLAIGALVARLVGVAALHLLLAVVRRGKFYRFSYYCAAAGVVTLVAAAAGAA